MDKKPQFCPWKEKTESNRFMMGSDHADNCGTELTKIKTSGLTEEQMSWVLFKSAIEVYGIQRIEG